MPDSASYIEVYNSIPFRRSEYAANPNYRHEATIELLLGQIRPKTVTNVTVSTPAATCCSPQSAMFDQWFFPWGTNGGFDYRKSRGASALRASRSLVWPRVTITT